MFCVTSKVKIIAVNYSNNTFICRPKEKEFFIISTKEKYCWKETFIDNNTAYSYRPIYLDLIVSINPEKIIKVNDLLLLHYEYKNKIINVIDYNIINKRSCWRLFL